MDLSRQILEEFIHRMDRMDGLEGIYTGYYFNVDQAEGITGTPSLATEKKGKTVLGTMIKAAARAVKIVQEDQGIPKLQQEILEKCGEMEEGRR